MARHVFRAPQDAKPWERQTGEGPRAWEAFQVYRDMGSDRSLRAAAERLSRSRKTLETLSVDFRWQDRIAAWEAEQDRVSRKAQLDGLRRMRKIHADLGAALLAKAARGLTRIPDDELKAADISRMVEVGDKLERIARGDVGEVIEEREGEALPVVTFYMPDNQRDDTDAD